MTEKKKKGIDVIDQILDACYKAFPDSIFIQSLMHQYEERGSLSKKQLQGLLSKAQKANDISANKLATLEATILKMATRFKSEKPLITEQKKDDKPQQLMAAILEKYPQHKRVLFLQQKFNNNEILTASDVSELEKFYKLLIK